MTRSKVGVMPGRDLLLTKEAVCLEADCIGAPPLCVRLDLRRGRLGRVDSDGCERTSHGEHLRCWQFRTARHRPLGHTCAYNRVP